MCEQTFTGHEGDKLRRELLENRGWAGDAFLRYLLEPGVLHAVCEDLERVATALWDPFYKFDKPHRFWVRAFACALVAGRIVNHLGILNFNASRIVAWAIERCQERRAGEGVRDNVALLNEALYDIWSSTLVVDVEWTHGRACLVLCAPSQNRNFIARRVRESGRMYVIRTWLRKWLVAHGVERTAFFREMLGRKVIVNENRHITLGAGTDYNTGGQIICYEIDMHHPAMMGALASAERDVPPDERERKPLSSILAPGPASPSPPSTLQ